MGFEFKIAWDLGLRGFVGWSSARRVSGVGVLDVRFQFDLWKVPGIAGCSGGGSCACITFREGFASPLVRFAHGGFEMSYHISNLD